jgi:sialate O-acetylesterase
MPLSLSKIWSFSGCWSLVLGAFFAFPAHATPHLPAIFGDHMVLQQDTKIPIWGWADPGETITITFGHQQRTIQTFPDGTWSLDLDPIPTNTKPTTLVVAGKDHTVTFTDVLVGDVWLASGQSNMEFGLQTDSRGRDAIAQATDSQIRLFFVPWVAALAPQTNLGPLMPPSPLNGKWLVCSPEIMATNWAWHGFSAVGYYFAREIRHAIGHPLGLIASYKGGTPAQAWTSLSGLEKEPSLAHYVADHQALVTNLAAAQAHYSTDRAEYETALRQWKAEDQKAKLARQPLAANSAPKPPTPPDGGYNAPANLFNGMIAPLIPYALKGVIWYQGEGNGNNLREASEYPVLFPRLIQDWRDHWAQGNFPFLYVQLPNINGRPKNPSEGSWPWVRDAQLQALSLTNTGMAVTIDIGEAENLHPPDKLYVGQRLALAARHIAYGQDLVYSGPLYDSMTVEQNKIRLKFRNLGGGLTIGTPPPTAAGTTLPAAKELTGFGIAAADQKFLWATAVLDGDTVLVTSDKIAHPIAVRYDWAQNPFGNLYNRASLPASPFRTDPWPPK